MLISDHGRWDTTDWLRTQWTDFFFLHRTSVKNNWKKKFNLSYSRHYYLLCSFQKQLHWIRLRVFRPFMYFTKLIFRWFLFFLDFITLTILEMYYKLGDRTSIFYLNEEYKKKKQYNTPGTYRAYILNNSQLTCGAL